GGQKDRLIGLVQQKYGYSRDQAQTEVERRFRDYNDTYSSTAKQASAKLHELGQNVADRARDAGAAVSNGMGKASSYFQEKEFRDMADDLVAVVRRYPIPFVLLALGIGYALARSAFGRDRYYPSFKLFPPRHPGLLQLHVNEGCRGRDLASRPRWRVQLLLCTPPSLVATLI